MNLKLNSYLDSGRLSSRDQSILIMNQQECHPERSRGAFRRGPGGLGISRGPPDFISTYRRCGGAPTAAAGRKSIRIKGFSVSACTGRALIALRPGWASCQCRAPMRGATDEDPSDSAAAGAAPEGPGAGAPVPWRRRPVTVCFKLRSDISPRRLEAEAFLCSAPTHCKNAATGWFICISGMMSTGERPPVLTPPSRPFQRPSQTESRLATVCVIPPVLRS